MGGDLRSDGLTARDDVKTYCNAILVSWHSEDENNPVVLGLQGTSILLFLPLLTHYGVQPYQPHL